jgi:hypothetical protein
MNCHRNLVIQINMKIFDSYKKQRTKSKYRPSEHVILTYKCTQKYPLFWVSGSQSKSKPVGIFRYKFMLILAN